MCHCHIALLLFHLTLLFAKFLLLRSFLMIWTRMLIPHFIFILPFCTVWGSPAQGVWCLLSVISRPRNMNASRYKAEVWAEVCNWKLRRYKSPVILNDTACDSVACFIRLPNEINWLVTLEREEQYTKKCLTCLNSVTDNLHQQS